ncbi:MAG: hypothetical protein ACREPA_00785 [Candidatus Dormibacteraceae bacterium]
MRFPFTLMAVLSLAFGIWILAYAAGEHARDSFTAFGAGLAGLALIVFGVYRLILSITRGGQA